jgi:hypothetical protein
MGHYFKALRTISFILCFVPVILGCATSKNQNSGFADATLSAKTLTEGIQLTLNNIPPDTNRMFIHIQRWSGRDENNVSSNDFISSFTLLEDSSLEQVKQTGIVIFPFVQAGHEYSIGVSFLDVHNKNISDWLNADIIAVNGVYLTNNVQLDLNNANSALTVSSRPIFSSDVTSSAEEFRFGVRVDYNFDEPGAGSVGIGTHHFPNGLSSDGLTWTFEPYFSNELLKGNYLEPGTYSATGTAYSNLVFDNITWSVEIGKIEFAYSL